MPDHLERCALTLFWACGHDVVIEWSEQCAERLGGALEGGCDLIYVEHER